MKKLAILSLYFGLVGLNGQEVSSLTQKQLKEITKNCKISSLKQEDNSQVLLCSKAFTESMKYQSAVNTIELAYARDPYNYDIRLQRILALNNVGNQNKAEEDLKRLIALYPQKAELHNYLARLQFPGHRIPSLMAFLWSMNTEGKEKFYRENLPYVKRLLSSDFDMKESKSAELASNLDSKHSMIAPVSSEDFTHAEFELNSTSTFNNQFTYQALVNKMNSLAKGLKETSHLKKGFYWETYAPYFIELYDQHLIEAFVSETFNMKSIKNPDKMKLQNLNDKYFK